MPARRWSEFQTKYDEMRMGVTREWIEKYFISECEKTLRASDSIDIMKISNLIYELKMRLQLAGNQDSAFAVASCVYFTLDENIVTYDHIENRKKIDRWKEDIRVEDFFSMKPMSDLLGFSALSKADILDFFKQIQIYRLYIEKVYPTTSASSLRR